MMICISKEDSIFVSLLVGILLFGSTGQNVYSESPSISVEVEIIGESVIEDGEAIPGETISLRVIVSNNRPSSLTGHLLWDEPQEGVKLTGVQRALPVFVPAESERDFLGTDLILTEYRGETELSVSGRLEIRELLGDLEVIPIGVDIPVSLGEKTTIPELSSVMTAAAWGEPVGFPTDLLTVRALPVVRLKASWAQGKDGLVLGSRILAVFAGLGTGTVEAFLASIALDELKTAFIGTIMETLMGSHELPPYTLLLAGRDRGSPVTSHVENLVLAATEKKTARVGTPSIFTGKFKYVTEPDNDGGQGLYFVIEASARDLTDLPEDFIPFNEASREMEAGLHVRPERFSTTGLVNQYQRLDNRLVMYLDGMDKAGRKFLYHVPVFVDESAQLPLPGSLVNVHGSLVESEEVLAHHLMTVWTWALGPAIVPEIIYGAVDSPIPLDESFLHEGPSGDLVAARDARRGAGAIDLVLILDSSGSMTENDPGGFRKTVSHFVVDRFSDDVRAAIIEFDKSATTLAALQELGQGRPVVHTAVDGVDSDGGTFIGSGLEEARRILVEGSTPGRSGGILLLTDGQDNDPHDYGLLVESLKQLDCRVFSVGLGPDINSELLFRLARGTDGAYFYAGSVADLAEIFHEILSRLTEVCSLAGFRGRVGPGEEIDYTVPVEPGAEVLGIDAAWGGSRLDLVLTPPDTFQMEDLQVRRVEGPTYLSLLVQDPPPGMWGIQVVGVDVPSAGEEFHLLTDIQSPTQLLSLGESESTPVGEALEIRTRLIAKDISPRSLIARAEIVAPNNETTEIQLVPQAASSDRTGTSLNQRVKGNQVSDTVDLIGFYRETIEPGDYNVKISVEADVTDGYKLQREIRQTARVGGEDHGPDTELDRLIRQLRAQSPSQRIRAIKKLEKQPSHRVLSQLRELLSDRVERVRSAAAWAITRVEAELRLPVGTVTDSLEVVPSGGRQDDDADPQEESH